MVTNNNLKKKKISNTHYYIQIRISFNYLTTFGQQFRPAFRSIMATSCEYNAISWQKADQKRFFRPLCSKMEINNFAI